MIKKNKKNKSGFSLIEAVVFLFIFVISVITLFESFNAGINYIIEAKKRLAAIGVANEEIEKMRNLGYDNLPAGATVDVPLVKNGTNFFVTTNISEIDDSEDGVAPADTISWDYKKINIEVKWSLTNERKKASMNAIIVPTIREEDANYGYMRLHIIDQNGSGLAGATVNVTDLGDNELVYSGAVNAGGDIFLTGLDPGYHKVAVTSASGNYPVETMTATATFDPADDHADIMVKTLCEKTIQTDKVSIINLEMKDTFNSAVQNLGFEITGGKLLGLENGTDNVYDFSDSVSDSDGSESFSNISFGPYFFNFTDLNDESSLMDYTFLWMDPAWDGENETFVDADETHDVTAVLAPSNIPSLLITLVDDVAGDPVEGAEINLKLESDPTLYDVTLTTNEFGKAYFPVNSGELTNDDYLIAITAPGFSNYDGNVSISDYTTKDITINEL